MVTRDGGTGSPMSPCGPAAAAILAAAVGCFAMGLLYVLGSASAMLNRLLTVYSPAGALSGMSTGTCLAWLATWAWLHWRWREKDVPIGTISTASLLLLAGGLILTFPPVARLF